VRVPLPAACKRRGWPPDARRARGSTALVTLFVQPLFDQRPPETDVTAQPEVRNLTTVNQTVECAGVTTQIFREIFDCPDLFTTYNRKHFHLGCRFAPGHSRCPLARSLIRLPRHAVAPNPQCRTRMRRRLPSLSRWFLHRARFQAGLVIALDSFAFHALALPNADQRTRPSLRSPALFVLSKAPATASSLNESCPPPPQRIVPVPGAIVSRQLTKLANNRAILKPTFYLEALFFSAAAPPRGPRRRPDRRRADSPSMGARAIVQRRELANPARRAWDAGAAGAGVRNRRVSQAAAREMIYLTICIYLRDVLSINKWIYSVFALYISTRCESKCQFAYLSEQECNVENTSHFIAIKN
jgi:hypothetical protein